MTQLSKTYLSKFLYKEKIGENTYNFYFEKNKNFNYFPGQYIKIFLDHKNPDSRGSSRFFTLSSSPNDSYLRISTRIVKSSFKKKLLTLERYEVVRIIGPVGYFDFSNDKVNKIFIAGGIGVTPFISLLSSLEKLNSSIFLINSYSEEKDILFKNELDYFKNKFKNFEYLMNITNKSSDFYINSNDIKKTCPDYLDSNFFIVGSINFENYLYNEVLKLGVREDKIFKENFTDL